MNIEQRIERYLNERYPLKGVTCRIERNKLKELRARRYRQIVSEIRGKETSEINEILEQYAASEETK